MMFFQQTKQPVKDYTMTSYFTPKNILSNATLTLRNSLCSQVAELLDNVRSKMHYRVYVVAQVRGACYSRQRVITIPKWVCTLELQNNRQWYVAHEIAHAYTHEVYGDNVQSHGAEFMEQLKQICPPKYLHFETAYKPRNAMQAGISQNKHLNNMLAGVMPSDF